MKRTLLISVFVFGALPMQAGLLDYPKSLGSGAGATLGLLHGAWKFYRKANLNGKMGHIGGQRYEPFKPMMYALRTVVKTAGGAAIGFVVGAAGEMWKSRQQAYERCDCEE